MQFIDTHTHLYLQNFDIDREAMLRRAFDRGTMMMLLPNIDKDSLEPLLKLADSYPGQCFPMLGLHPTSVGSDVEDQLMFLEQSFQKAEFKAVGEIGIDLYWDQTYRKEQILAFRTQLRWAKDRSLPVAIHSRDAFPLILDLVEEEQDGRLKGVFHCFTGDKFEAERILHLNFFVGIGGVITYKKSTLPEVLKHIPLTSILLETDAPFLPPVPYRGKRNESAYILEIAEKLAEVKQESLETIAEITTQNAQKLFNINAL
ncbi:MAG: hydrolase TatD [Bacteroidetes bacterium HGW-Bacteroidetes-1]|jgi:TatD DNase family protein|nr:MAG: hydrolase TatD [Bacteroidetes bacterium HGW-Bacteroidetes-1]